MHFRTVFASELISFISNRMVDLGLTFTPLENGVQCEQVSARGLLGHTSRPESHPLIVACSERAHPVLYARLLERVWIAQSGAGLKVIQEAAGHMRISMSARCAHLDQTMLLNAMSVLNAK